MHLLDHGRGDGQSDARQHPAAPRPAAAAVDHDFWADEISLTDARRFDLTRVPHPRLLTDAYLLGLAVMHKARLVTFDHGIPSSAVLGATGKHLLTL